MKQPILILVTFFFLNFLTAQNSKFGVIGGFNYSDVRGDIGFIDSNYRLSFHIGGIAEFSISEKLVFMPQIVYSSQGYIGKLDTSRLLSDQFIDPAVLDEDFKVSNRLNYLSIPLLLKIKLTEKFSLDGGVQLGFLLNEVSVPKSGFISDSSLETIRYNGDFKLDYGVKLGASYNLNDKTFLQLGYYHGLSNITRQIPFDIKRNNSVFNLSVGYLLF